MVKVNFEPGPFPFLLQHSLSGASPVCLLQIPLWIWPSPVLATDPPSALLLLPGDPSSSLVDFVPPPLLLVM
ncbi:hypothetical protein Mapa_009022 [Marchantia paleacea]|nr:hypothetical protein Mapa_009022 [Marchantia paleacea]